ncbi:DUF5050 domain-containing protein [Aquimarina sp. Aq78]|uniref:DUF5050 domain-containing protein n=1 Tax=Aquimarina sp. Aq78 TaxID=1191889 RepID=UPI000D0F1745|nr:DUF5050 domain-containing protein [Aquimarina sp. Aq78]
MKYIKTIGILLPFLSFLVGYSQNNKKSESTSYTIAYSSKESGDGEIYLTDEDGKSKIRITDRPGNDGYVAWSPDGKHIASYGYYDGGNTWSIHTMNMDGTNRKRLTHAKNKWDSAPTWSPDGRKIAFARGYSNAEGVWYYEIWIMNSDGSRQTQIKPLNGGGPCFTPDGRIVFHSEHKDKNNEISIADIDGNNIIQLTNNEAKELHPEVSADGKQIVFMSDRDGNFEIYKMNTDGSNQKRLTHNDVDDWNPSWSPDGSRLLYSSQKENEYPNIYMIDKDDSSLKKIITNGSGPAWLKLKK